jgi:hypothetical protein
MDLVSQNLKVCNTCFVEKTISLFGKDKTCKIGYRPKCKECRRPGKQLHYQLNKEKYKQAFNAFKVRQKMNNLGICGASSIYKNL